MWDILIALLEMCVGNGPTGKCPSPTSRKYNKTCHLYGPHKWETIFVGIYLLGQPRSDTILRIWPNLTQKLAQVKGCHILNILPKDSYPNRCGTF